MTNHFVYMKLNHNTPVAYNSFKAHKKRFIFLPPINEFQRRALFSELLESLKQKEGVSLKNSKNINRSMSVIKNYSTKTKSNLNIIIENMKNHSFFKNITNNVKTIGDKLNDKIYKKKAMKEILGREDLYNKETIQKSLSIKWMLNKKNRCLP